MKAKNLIKRVTIGILAVVLSTSVVWADDNPGLIQRAKDACKNAKELDVKNVILYHTEDKSLETRKEAYIKEGQEVFNGNIYVPDDLDIISL